MTRPIVQHSVTIGNSVFCYSVPENSSTVRKGVAIAGTFFHFLGQCLLSAGKRIINYPIHIISSRSDTVSSTASSRSDTVSSTANRFELEKEYAFTNHLYNGGFGLGGFLDEDDD